MATPLKRRRALLREKNRNLFDLLLDETDPWEVLPEEHQAVAIQTLARLIAQMTLESHKEEEHHE
jgi:hypothetical protein